LIPPRREERGERGNLLESCNGSPAKQEKKLGKKGNAPKRGIFTFLPLEEGQRKISLLSLYFPVKGGALEGKGNTIKAVNLS